MVHVDVLTISIYLIETLLKFKEHIYLYLNIICCCIFVKKSSASLNSEKFIKPKELVKKSYALYLYISLIKH